MIYMIFILPSTNKMQNNFTVFLFHFFDDNLWFCRTPVLSLGLGVDFVSPPSQELIKGSIPIKKCHKKVEKIHILLDPPPSPRKFWTF